MSWNLEEAMEYYAKQGAPSDQNAVISLLREVQKESGGSVPEYALNSIADFYGLRVSFLHAIIRRVPSLRLGNVHCLELCAGPNCGRHTALAACAEALCRMHPEKITLKYVPCMRMCGKGPNIRWDGKVYHSADEKLLKKLAEES